MKTIIKKLYYGTLNPDDIILNEDKEYKKLNDQIINLMEKIKNEIGEENYNRISELAEVYAESNALEAENSFIYGFKYGAILMMEILQGEIR